VRNTQLRHAHMKNGDAQIMWLCHHVSYYSVIRDAHSSASSIRIH
jgi:hypothetical protein